MPLQLPVLDDRNFEQLLDEARKRIPSFTPEWTNFGLESDPGITVVQLFAFLTESLLYRANRIPERNRLKFLQLLGVPLQPAAAADGIITIRNDRGPFAVLPLNRGVVVSAGKVDFLTRDGLNVLPVEVQVYYKLRIAPTDPRYADYSARYEAIRVAQQVAAEEAAGITGSGTTTAPAVTLDFYETTLMPAPTPGTPNPVVDLAQDTTDGALYLALLAPKNVDPATVPAVIANQTLSIGVVPSVTGDVAPLLPVQPVTRPAATTNLIYEIANVQPGDPPVDSYARLPLLAGPDVLNATGVVQVQLPDATAIKTWDFSDPLLEGTFGFPPRLEDEQVAQRVVTWVRMRLPSPDPSNVNGNPQARLTWVGINAARMYQAVPVFNENLGSGNGEPDQLFALANTPVLPASATVVVQDVVSGTATLWRQIDDLLAAGVEEAVFTLDPEAGQVRFGDGLHGARPPVGSRVLISYEYGGGPQGNVGIGAVKASRETRLSGGYKIENPVPTSGGDLGESVAEGERNIPLYLRHRDRLVTLQDFKDVAGRTPGVDVGRVEVLSLFVPSTGQDDAAGVVTVMVIPRFDPLRPLWPVPDRLFLRRVCDYLDARRLVTTEIYVRGPQYVPVYVSVGIQVRGGYFADVVRQTVSDRLNGYLSSLPPGGSDGSGWPLKKRLLKKDLEAVITRVAGVEYVDSIEMGVKSPVDIDEYDLSGLELPLLAGLTVVDGSAEPLADVFGTQAGTQPAAGTVVPVPVSRSTC